MTGKSIDAAKARVALGMLAFGTGIQLLAMFSLGVDGFARELSTYTSSSYELRNIISLIGVVIGGFGLIGVLVNLMQSNSSGAHAGNDPWRAGTLEWFVPSPPPVNNFDAIPAVASDTPLPTCASRSLPTPADSSARSLSLRRPVGRRCANQSTRSNPAERRPTESLFLAR